jgi:hypothetical protein
LLTPLGGEARSASSIVHATLNIGHTQFTFNASAMPNADGMIDFNNLGIQGSSSDAGKLTITGVSDGLTEPFEIPVGVPVTVSRSIELGATNVGGGIAMSFSDDFNATFSWATDGPVFDLPPGYTVNGAGIVDNHYSLPVPEPQTLGLVIAAIATWASGLALRRTAYPHAEPLL